MSRVMSGIYTAVAAALMLAFLIGAAPKAEARELDEILDSKEIHLGYIIYPPLMNRDPQSGELSGFVIEALNFMFESIKIKPVWVEVGWSTFAAALQSDQIDIFVGGSFATPQRSLALAFTQPFAYMGNDVVVRKADAESKFKDVRELADLDQEGLTIASQLGGAPYDYLKAHFTKAKIVGVESSNQSQASLEVLAGHADAAYWDAFISARDVQEHPEQLTSLSWAIKRKEPELLAFLNTMLEYMETNGTWIEFERPYRAELGGYFHVKREYVPAGGPSAE